MSAIAIPAEHFDHGDHRRYNRGCKCRPCTNAAVSKARRNKYLRNTGRGTLVPPTRAAEHIAKLRAADVDNHTILGLAEVSRDAFYRIARGEGRIRRTTETRILAIHPATAPRGHNGALRPALATVRRLRALAADGWPTSFIGAAAGRDKAYIAQIQSADLNSGIRICANVEAAIEGAYRQLASTSPEDRGVAKHAISRVRNWAAAKGWAGTAYWDDDDFHNPDFEPATDDTPPELALAENWTELKQQGFSMPEAAVRLGVTVEDIRAAVVRHGRGRAQRGPCSYPSGCAQPSRTRGLCNRHYKQVRNAERRAVSAGLAEAA